MPLLIYHDPSKLRVLAGQSGHCTPSVQPVSHQEQLVVPLAKKDSKRSTQGSQVHLDIKLGTWKILGGKVPT